MKIYNTMTRSKEEFVPRRPGEVGMYVCGVTVYDYCHVGHARSAIVFDVIRRWFEYRDYRVTFVKNFTDIDDKIIRRAQQEGVADWEEIPRRYIEAYEADMGALGVLPREAPGRGHRYFAPRATEHIGGMLDLIAKLVRDGSAYVVDGDVYFEVRRFPEYGRLSGKNIEELMVGSRVDVDERKRDPRDFALWKSAKPGEPSWESPWGPGRPGWHIECSAMSMKFLGPSFDIHGGGEDLVFPHHECEIAQSEAANSQRFARYWIHNGFVNLAAEKMSKSLGNVLTIRDLLDRHQADALRLYLLQTHYRNPVEWGEDRVREAARALERFARLQHDVQRFWPKSSATPPVSDDVRAFTARFEAVMDDDFNTPQALGVLFDLSSHLYELQGPAGRDQVALDSLVAGVERLAQLCLALGLFQGGVPFLSGPPAEVEQLRAERDAARQRRDWASADRLRQQIQGLGFVIEDTPRGSRVLPRNP